MGSIVRVDGRGRLVIPSELRESMKTGYVEVRGEGERLVLIPVPDPLDVLRGRVSRAKPLRGLSEAAEEEAERIIGKRRRHANP